MEPVSSVAVAIATLVLTKAFERTGEILSEKVVEKSDKLARLLKQQSHRTTTTIERGKQHPWDYGQVVLEEIEAAVFADWEIAEAVREVEAAAKEDPSVAQSVQAVANAIKSERSSLYNYAKVAEKAGVLT